jgi:hypothetical protein
MMRTATRMSERITIQNRQTLAAAGTPYHCYEVDCEEEPTHYQRIVAEAHPTEDRTRFLCTRHAEEGA